MYFANVINGDKHVGKVETAITSERLWLIGWDVVDLGNWPIMFGQDNT